MNIDHPNLSFNFNFNIADTFLVYIDTFEHLKFFKKFENLYKQGVFDIYSKKYNVIKTKKLTKKFYEDSYNYLINCRATKLLNLREGVCILLDDNSVVVVYAKQRDIHYCKHYLKYIEFLTTLGNVKDVLGGGDSMYIITTDNTIIYYDSDDYSGGFIDNLHISNKFEDIKDVKYDEDVGFTILHNNSTFSVYNPDSKLSERKFKKLINSSIKSSEKEILDWLACQDHIFIFYSDNSYILYNILNDDNLEPLEFVINKSLTVTEETDDEIYLSYYDASDKYLNTITLVKNFKIIACNYFMEDSDLFCTLYKTKNANNIPLEEYLLTAILTILEPLEYKYSYLDGYILIIIMNDNSLRIFEDADYNQNYVDDVNVFNEPNSQCFVKDLREHTGSYI